MAKSFEKKSYFALMALLLVIAFILGYYTFAYWHTPSEQAQIKTVPTTETLVLNAKPIHGQDIKFTRRYIGYVTAIHEAEIQSFINGFIEKVYVSGGQFVKKGDLLLELDQDQYRAELAAAEADILKANATYQNALTYYERLQKAGTKAISQTEQDNAMAQLLTSRAALEQTKANFALAEVNFNYTIIRAPIDGIVGNVTLTEGNYVSPASGALISIMQYDPIRVVFSITDKEYLSELIKPHPFREDQISLLLPNGQLYAKNGVFAFADNAINRQTNSIAVYADFRNEDQILVPNAYVTVLLQKTFQNALNIDKDYVLLEEKGSFIYIIREGMLKKVQINILASENTSFIIKNTFKQGDYLVMQSVNHLDLNKPVQVQNQREAQ